MSHAPPASRTARANERAAHERVKADDCIAGEIRANPGVDRTPLATVIGRLAYCDLRGLEQIIVSKPLWPRFTVVFGAKESLNNRFRQLASLRNANAHLREVDDLVRSDAEAAVIWFNAVLARLDKEQQGPVDLPLEDNAARDSDAVSIDNL